MPTPQVTPEIEFCDLRSGKQSKWCEQQTAPKRAHAQPSLAPDRNPVGVRQIPNEVTIDVRLLRGKGGIRDERPAQRAQYSFWKMADGR